MCLLIRAIFMLFGFPSLGRHLQGLVMPGRSNQGRSFHAEI
jgi:hypothetical protein